MFGLGLLHELGLTGGERFIDSMIPQAEEARPLYEQAAAGGCVEAKERLAYIGNGIGAVQCIKRMAAEGYVSMQVCRTVVHESNSAPWRADRCVLCLHFTVPYR